MAAPIHARAHVGAGMTLLHDLISIPERVHKGDFVLKLTEGVTRGAETVRDYVVTDPLAKNFDEALGLIRSAVDAHSSKAAYLHGSFGSGKSHFMAMLHLLLAHEQHARAVPELAGVVSKHAAWIEGKRFLLVPYHMIGAKSLEQALVEGYLRVVKELHPDAPLPAVFRADAIFADAVKLRETVGDTAFFQQLSSGTSAPNAAAGGGWGKLGSAWDARSFDAAVAAPPSSDDRRRLARDLVSRFFASYSKASGEDAYVDTDDALFELSRHAKSLGYDALILFLDELILWLASHLADASFITREAQKVPKLVESGTTARPCPIVSFVARQRDLKELVGEHVPGAEKLAFADVLQWWKGRFETITLEDRNLAAIAEKRLLRPKNASARAEIDRAFERTGKVRESILSTLLAREGDRETFRQVYPFSPAVVNVLVAVSSALQRERTALRVMLQLLVDQRDTLEVGKLIPVGDLFDVIAEGDEPFSDDLRKHFENTKKLWTNKLLPMLESLHDVRWENVKKAAPTDLKARAFHAEAKLIKTLLLAALVPEAESFRGLTASRLHALNHGTIETPIAGRETQDVVARARQWATRVGEVRIGEGTDPTLTIQVTGVDIEPILAKAVSDDTKAERIRKIRETLYRLMGVSAAEITGASYPWEWRGTKRCVDVVFGNVRELPTESFKATGGSWKVVFDYPFDESGFSPQYDLARLDTFTERELRGRTVCWLPSFFSREMQTDLGTLVRLDRILTGERFRGYTDHLSDVDRQQARLLLDNLRSQLENKLVEAIEAAYGLRSPPARALDEGLASSEHLRSLDPSFMPRLPVGSTLKAAFEQLLDQMLSHQFPAHPTFEQSFKAADLRKVLEVAAATAATPDLRSTPEAPLRLIMRRIAMPLGLGEQHEQAFLLKESWKNHFLKKAALSGPPLTVAMLRDFTDDPKKMGLPREVQNLLILVFATMTGKSFTGAKAEEASIESLDDKLELRDQKLPSPADWKTASERADKLFGIGVRPLLNVQNATHISRLLEEKCLPLREPARQLRSELDRRASLLGIQPNAPRLASATDAAKIVEILLAAKPEDRIDALAHAKFDCPLEAVASSLASAEPQVIPVLRDTRWDFVSALGSLIDARHSRAQAALKSLRESFEGHEYLDRLAPAFHRFCETAVQLLAQQIDPSPPPPRLPPAPPGESVVDSGSRTSLKTNDAEALFSKMLQLMRAENRSLDITWTIRETDRASKGKSERGQQP